jgi:hypothetical protein
VDWDDRAEALLEMLCAMVPETLRSLAEAAAREEGELVASERGAGSVEDGDVLRGWIRVTPPDQRNSLVAVIESLGYEAADFAAELEDAEAWGGDEE